MSAINFNAPAIKKQIHETVVQMISWNGLGNNKTIRQRTEEFYNDKLVSSADYYISPYEFKEHIERAMEQKDCTVSFENGCLIQVVRQAHLKPKKYITKYYREE